MTRPALLRLRIRRASDQIREQHEQIAPMFAQLNSAIANGNLRDAQTISFRVQGALRAHFLLEQEIVFPVVGALDPALSDELQSFEDEHELLESRFRELIDQILGGDRSAASELLSAFVVAIVEHERLEEYLLERAVGGAREKAVG